MTQPAAPIPSRAQAVGHAHVADLEACLDFINSEAYSDGIPEERLRTLEEGVAYFTLRGLGHEDALRGQASPDPVAWLARLHAARAAVREVWDAQVEARTPKAAAIDTLNELLGHAPRVELVSGLGGVSVGHRHADEDPTGEALARVVQPLVDAIAASDTDRFRICDNHGCRWAFSDSSRAGRRRWCDMAQCGNRAKVRRYRSRRKAGVAAADAAAETGG